MAEEDRMDLRAAVLESFSYDGLMVEIAQKELDRPEPLVRVNIKGQLLFYTDDGDEIVYPLKDSHRFTRPGLSALPGLRGRTRRHLSSAGWGRRAGWTPC